MAILAKEDVVVHRLLAPEVDGEPAATESVVLSDGESLPDDEVPGYLLSAVKAGDTVGLVLVSDKEAQKAGAKKAADDEAAANRQEINASNAEEDADKA